MKRIPLFSCIGLATLVAILSLVFAIGGDPSNAQAGTSLQTMSTAGTPVQLTSRGHRTVDRINEDRAYGLKTASLLATEGSTSFYKISGATRTCLSVGASAEVGSFYGATCELPTPD